MYLVVILALIYISAS